MTTTANYVKYAAWKATRTSLTSGTYGDAGQVSELDLVVSFIMAQEDVGSPLTLWVTLENSLLRVGKPLQDDVDDAVGYFQDRIDVTLTLGLPGKKAPIHYFNRIVDGPPTYNGSGAISSSVTVSGSGGFFGYVPTANVGVSDTHSFTQSLQDFETINDSDSVVARHAYVMKKSTGGDYNQPSDLMPDWGFSARFSAIKIHRPPALALDNLTLMSQAVWQTATGINPPDPETLKKPHVLYVDVKQHLTWVRGDYQPLMYPAQFIDGPTRRC